MERFLDFLVNQLDEDDETQNEIIRYALEIIIMKAVFFMGAMAIGALMRRLPECISFFVSFSMIRSYAGGYHEKTRIMCFIKSMLMYVISLVMMMVLDNHEYLNMLLAITSALSALYIWSVSPVDSENRRLDSTEKNSIGKKVKVCICIESAAAAFARISGFNNISAAIMLGIVNSAILVFKELKISKKSLGE